MSESAYSQIPGEKLAEVFSRSISIMDGLWFVALEEKYGFDTALELDVEVWRRFGLIEGKRMMETFAIKEDSPIRAVMRVMQVVPTLVIFKPEIVSLTDNKAVFRFTDCPPQKIRIRQGKGEFSCKPVGIAFYGGCAEAVSPEIKLSCLTCPPDAHPPQYWCEWQFEI